jgi:hypothetical protein
MTLEQNNDFEKLLKEDFKNFLFVIWHHLGLPDPTPIQYEIADFLQSPIKRKITEAFRGVGKSWITSAYVLWRLYRDPDYKVLVVSASKDRATDFTAFTKKLIKEVPFLQYLQPDKNAGQRDSMISFDVGPARSAHAPSVKSVGIFGQLTGSRAVEIIADDVEVPNNSATQDMRDKLLKAVSEFEAIIVPGGQITYLGTPQTEESIYNKLRQNTYQARIWPAKYPTLSQADRYAGGLAPTIEEAIQKNSSIIGKPTDPLRFTEIDLLEREAAYGRSGFALQFMLDTSLSDAEKYPLKTSDLVIMPLNIEKAPVSLQWSSGPEYQILDLPNVGFSGDRWHRPMFIDKENWIPYEGAVMTIDPSGRGADETGYAITKQLHGSLFLTAAGGLKGGYDDITLVKLAKLAKEYQVNHIIIEANFGDGMFTKIFLPVLARYWPCTVEEVKHSIQKERRIIDTLEPVMNRHRLVVDLSVIQDDLKTSQDDISYSLFYQMTRITKERGALKHDDRLDALAMAVAYWVESMARDEQTALDDFKNAAREKELAEFMEQAIGGPSSPNRTIGNNWIHSRNTRAGVKIILND